MIRKNSNLNTDPNTPAGWGEQQDTICHLEFQAKHNVDLLLLPTTLLLSIYPLALSKNNTHARKPPPKSRRESSACAAAKLDYLSHLLEPGTAGQEGF